MTTMLFSALVVYLPVWWLTQSMQNHGLWLAFSLFNIARGVSLYLIYLRLNRDNAWLKS
jgi:MATE family multidrug resistance protein